MPQAASEAKLRVARDASLHQGLRLATLVIGALEAFFVLVDLVVTPAPAAARIATADALLAAAFFGAYGLVRAGLVQPRHAHPLAAALALLISGNVFHDAHVLGDPQQTTYLVLVVLGAGSLFLSTAWLALVVVASFGGWALVAAQRPDLAWTTFGFALFAACVLALLVHAVRQRTFDRMEAMRLAEAERKGELEARGQALESAVRALRESEDRYRRLVEGAPDGFLVISEGRILYANPTAVRMFAAQGASELVGLEALRLVADEHADLVRARLAKVEAGLATEPAEIRCRRLDGTTFDVEVIGQPITYLGKRADQTVMRDITDRKRAEAERLVARERLAEISRLREMDRVKTQFVNAISHELRTPLTPVKVQLHILKRTQEAPAVTKAVEVMERNVDRLGGLVDELLEVARIQAGTLRLAKSEVDLGEVVAHALASYEDVARQRGVEL
ncbi:MAG TPA: PAS domain-containing sensor histidine kinase, partial [Candidatus Thermoplasmatota archaeon]|nr:PAS domain-containing sensor histidine kinase [Candidatus Thermoplasmatota archaeon]